MDKDAAWTRGGDPVGRRGFPLRDGSYSPSDRCVRCFYRRTVTAAVAVKPLVVSAHRKRALDVSDLG